jgi:thiaminase/transcriptional activator TenA
MTLAHHLQLANHELFQKILAHPFNVQMHTGFLLKEHFRDFLWQDKIYLKGLAEALGIISKRLHTEHHKISIGRVALQIISTEQRLITNYINDAPSRKLHFFQPEITALPTTLEYIRFLSTNAKDSSLSIAVASCIPCFNVYCFLGNEMSVNSLLPSHPYKRWLKCYASPSFRAANSVLNQVLNDLSLGWGPEVSGVYTQALQFEYDFFEQINLNSTSCNPSYLSRDFTHSFRL